VGDDRLRALERIWRETGDLVAEEAWLRERARAGDPFAFGRHVTQIPAVRAELEAAERASAHDRPLVIVGARGSGRTTLARAIHGASARASGPFRSCLERGESRLEAELFGYAMSGHPMPEEVAGATELAHGGTLVISPDEALSAGVQAKLRRCLNEGDSRRVGASETRSVDLRFVFEVLEVEHLGEVWQSLEPAGAVVLDWPSLAERGGDIYLVLGGLDTEGLNLGGGLFELLEAHDWPGGLRELDLLVEQARDHERFGLTLEGLDPSAFETQALELFLRSAH